jgi:type VI secretion system secreted protein Hcp
MAFDMFLNFPQPANGPTGTITIKGESQDQNHLNWIGVKSVAFGIENPITIGSATSGAGVGKAKLDQLEITKAVDSASPLLFSAVGLGVHFPTVTLAIRKAGGTTAPTDYLIYTFAMVFVSEVSWSAESGDDTPTEKVTLVYGAMSISYAKQSPTGALLTPVVSNWSQVLNQPTLAVQ